MANDEHVEMLKKGVDAWNAWRDENPNVLPDLSGESLLKANLSGANLQNADLSFGTLVEANLRGANLKWANLFWADLRGANLQRAELNGTDLSGDLSGADLSGADLTKADLGGAKLSGADLSGTKLHKANLTAAILDGANLAGATLFGTIFGGPSSLIKVQGLDQCHHGGPSIVDFLILQRSGPLPVSFLRGVGLPDTLIDYLPSLLNIPIQFYSCFISYSSKDQAFAERLHADLQNKSVRCWFAPNDMPIGAKIIDAIDEAIRLRDKVLLILSERAIASDWVEGEVTRALDEERTRKQVVLFPVRLDDAVMQTSKAWARLLRGQRNIGDFTGWKERDSYQRSLDRLMRDLRVKPQGGRDAPETR
jgi:TIR domain/Pentapeptide repeats (8 copies)